MYPVSIIIVKDWVWAIYLFTCLFIYLFIYSFIYLFIYLFIHLFIYLFIYLLIYLFIYLFIYFLLANFISIYNEISLPQTARPVSNPCGSQQYCGMLVSLTRDIWDKYQFVVLIEVNPKQDKNAKRR